MQTRSDLLLRIDEQCHEGYAAITTPTDATRSVCIRVLHNLREKKNTEKHKVTRKKTNNNKMNEKHLQELKIIDNDLKRRPLVHIHTHIGDLLV